MGDYVKLIVSCQVDVPEKELKKEIEHLELSTSAYHSQERIISIEKSDWHHRKEDNVRNLIIVGQTRYGRGQEEFLSWLRPFVIDASGPAEIWAFQISEYGDDGLTVHKLRNHEATV